MSAAQSQQQTFTRDELLELLTVEPCHVTGMHDPTHTIKYVCETQTTKALRRLLDALGATEDELPRRLADDCGWCHYHDEKDPDNPARLLLVAWANREPIRFTLHELTYTEERDQRDPRIPHEPEFDNFSDAWERATDLPAVRVCAHTPSMRQQPPYQVAHWKARRR